MDAVLLAVTLGVPVRRDDRCDPARARPVAPRRGRSAVHRDRRARRHAAVHGRRGDRRRRGLAVPARRSARPRVSRSSSSRLPCEKPGRRGRRSSSARRRCSRSRSRSCSWTSRCTPAWSLGAILIVGRRFPARRRARPSRACARARPRARTGGDVGLRGPRQPRSVARDRLRTSSRAPRRPPLSPRRAR